MQHLDDWHFVANKQIIAAGGLHLIQDGRLFDYLQEIYPNHPWRKPPKQMVVWGKAQWALFRTLTKVLEERGICLKDTEMNYKHPSAVYSDTKKQMEFDIYIPSLKLVIEYQGMF